MNVYFVVTEDIRKHLGLPKSEPGFVTVVAVINVPKCTTHNAFYTADFKVTLRVGKEEDFFSILAIQDKHARMEYANQIKHVSGHFERDVFYEDSK